MARERLAADGGSILPLVAGVAALGLVIVLLAAGATSLYLERKRLFDVADAAALAGAEAFELDQVSVADGSLSVALRDADVEAAVRRYLAGRPAATAPGVRLEGATASGSTAIVRLSARWRPPVLAALLPEGVRVEATSTARAVLR
ncbi:MAG: pilus assembly protein TadG-related protein [Microbacteriaceae bacterium]